MPRYAAIPADLLVRPFTRSEALARGLSSRVLDGARFVRLFPGVYASADLLLDRRQWLIAASLALPADAVVSHLSAAQLWGFSTRDRDRLEFSTNTAGHGDHSRVILHRRGGTLHPQVLDGLRVTGPDRTFVDCATRMSLVQLVQFGDVLLHSQSTTPEVLGRYVEERHLHGVQRARLAVAELDARAESPMESLVRMSIVLSGLPRPQVNVWIGDLAGRRLARADLLLDPWKILVEYDGMHHERDARQRQRDRERREDLEALGYRLIVVTNADVVNLRQVPWRVHQALRARGWVGAPPEFGSRWGRWFAPPTFGSPATENTAT